MSLTSTSSASSSWCSSSVSSSSTTPTAPDDFVVPSNAPKDPELEFYIDPLASEDEKLILYSNAVYEYTRQLWIRSRHEAQIELASSVEWHRRRAMKEQARLGVTRRLSAA